MGAQSDVVGRPRAWRWARRLLVAAAAAGAAIALLGFVAAPPIIKHTIEKRIGGWLGRRVTVSGVRVNPFTLSLTVDGLQVFEADGHTTFVGFSRLHANLEAVSLFQRCLVLRELRLESPRGRVVREKTGPTRGRWFEQFNFAEVVTRLARVRWPRFSLSNVQVIDGALIYDDRPTASRHEITALYLGVPFVSTLAIDADVFVTPALNMRIDGAPFAVGGRIKPFHGALQSAAEVRLSALDLTRFAANVPAELPVELASGLLTLDLDVVFVRRQRTAPTLVVTGSVALRQIAVRDQKHAPLVQVGEVEITVGESDPFARRFAFPKVVVAGVEAHVRRLSDGTLDWQRLLAGGGTRGPPAGSPAHPAVQSGGAQNGGPPRLRLEIAELRVDSSRAYLHDGAVRPELDLTFPAISLLAHNISNAPAARGQLSFELRAGAAGSVEQQGSISLDPLAATGSVTASGVDLARLAPYYRDRLPVDIAAGQARLSTRYSFQLGSDGPRLALWDSTVTVADAVVRQRGAPARQPLLRLAALSVREARVDFARRAAYIGLLRTRGGRLHIRRDRPAPATSASSPAPVAARPAGPRWTLTLARLDLDRWSADLEDHSVQPPVVLSASPLAIRATGLGTGPGARSVIDVDMGFGARGHVAVKGTASLEPLAGDLRFDLRSIELPPLQPYLAQRAPLTISKGTLSTAGRIRLAAHAPQGSGAALLPPIDLAADIEVANLASFDARDHQPVVAWRSLRAAGLALSTAPFRLVIDDLGIKDVAARFVHRADGHGSNGAQSGARAASKPAPASSTTRTIAIKQLTLQGGRVGFVDRAVRPPFATELDNIAARVSGLSFAARNQAQVSLSGRIDGSAPFAVGGTLTLARPPSADLKLSLRNLDLPPASPYAGEHVGYVIRKGKLDLMVACHIVRGKIDSHAHLVINKLELGDKVDSPDATTINVPRAIALLKNRRGVIELELPISGVLGDRKFDVWSMVGDAVAGVLTRVATEPFAHIVKAFSGSDAGELSFLDFQPGRATLDASEAAKITALAAALRDHPKLSFEIEGDADPARDMAGARTDELVALAGRRANTVRDALARAQPAALARLFVVLPRVASGVGSRVQLRLKTD